MRLRRVNMLSYESSKDLLAALTIDPDSEFSVNSEYEKTAKKLYRAINDFLSPKNMNKRSKRQKRLKDMFKWIEFLCIPENGALRNEFYALLVKQLTGNPDELRNPLSFKSRSPLKAIKIKIPSFPTRIHRTESR